MTPNVQQEGGVPMAVDVKDEVAMDVTEGVKTEVLCVARYKTWYNLQKKISIEKSA